MNTELFGAGDTILKAGEAGDGRVFFIESGRVSVLVPLDEGGHQRIASLGPGMAFGEMTLLGQTQRTASVVADSDVRCRVLHVNDLEALAQYVRQEFLRTGLTVCTLSLWDGGELIAYAPEVRAFVYAGLRIQPLDAPDTEEGKP